MSACGICPVKGAEEIAAYAGDHAVNIYFHPVSICARRSCYRHGILGGWVLWVVRDRQRDAVVRCGRLVRDGLVWSSTRWYGKSLRALVGVRVHTYWIAGAAEVAVNARLVRCSQ